MAFPRESGRSGRFIRWFLAATAAASLLVATGGARAQDQAPPPDPTPVGQGADPQAQGGQASAQGAEADASGGQVLTQGPVHEAFATPVVHDPKQAPVVAKQPPDPIQETPPDQKPVGQHIQWIPGYWAWDTARNDYLWVSGVWREPPPGTQWVPGYWHDVSGGFQWVPGSWMPASTAPAQGSGQAAPSPQATYLPPPPATMESGPNSPQPGPNTAWTPGYWTWQGGGYAWRPGFWAAVQPNWIWMPPHYVWTPSGYLFVPGYWDLPVANRGLMFAPVYYPQPVYAQAGFTYTPSIGITASAMTSNLFVSVGTGQYMFGNYYGQANVGVGIVPWFQFSLTVGRPAFYDPLFAHYAVVNLRANPQWIVQVREAYRLRVANIAMRPPGTYAEQLRVMRSIAISRDIAAIDHRNMAMSLREMAADRVAARTMRLEHVAAAERQQIMRQTAALHQMRAQRASMERAAAREGLANRPRTMNMPHSPVAAHPTARAAGHPGGDGARAAVARRDEASRSAESRGRAESGADEERRSASSRESGRSGSRQSGRSASSRGRSRSGEERERERP